MYSRFALLPQPGPALLVGHVLDGDWPAVRPADLVTLRLAESGPLELRRDLQHASRLAGCQAGESRTVEDLLAEVDPGLAKLLPGSCMATLGPEVAVLAEGCILPCGLTRCGKSEAADDSAGTAALSLLRLRTAVWLP